MSKSIQGSKRILGKYSIFAELKYVQVNETAQIVPIIACPVYLWGILADHLLALIFILICKMSVFSSEIFASMTALQLEGRSTLNLATILSECLDSNEAIRNKALKAMEQVQALPQYPVELSSIIANSTNHNHRLLAAINLKNNILSETWNAISTEDKMYIKKALSQMIGDHNTSIQSNIVFNH